MVYGIFYKPVTSIYEVPAETKLSESGMISAIADEGLCGMCVAITGVEQSGFLPIKTHYNYLGYVRKSDVQLISLEALKRWEASELMVLNSSESDVLSIPKVQGVPIITLPKGSIIELIEWENNCSGWAKVGLANGQLGYVRNQILAEKKFSQGGLWQDSLPQKMKINEEEFRDQIVSQAKKYCGVQYRWGGKSTRGIDCSGLTSMCYMLEGILIYRDAKIVNGFPIKEIQYTDMKKGDLLYFPGHIAMYIGGDRYINSTAKKGSDGVVINSLNPNHADYRHDLAQSLYAIGSIFC